MHTPSWFERNKAVLVTIATTSVMQLCGLVWVLAVLRSDVDDMKDRSIERSAVIDTRFNDLATWRREVDQQNLGWRLSTVEKQMNEINVRLDRMNDNIVAALERVNAGIGGLDKRLDLLAQRVETMTPPRRASAPGGVQVQ